MRAEHLDNGIGYNPAFLKRVAAKRERQRAEQQRMERQEAARRDQEAMRRENIRDELAKAAREAVEKANSVAANSQGRRTSFVVIVRRFCTVFGVTREEMKSRKRRHNITLCKQAIAYWARRNGMSYAQIGRFMGGKDHTVPRHNSKVYPMRRAAMGRHLRELQ